MISQNAVKELIHTRVWHQLHAHLVEHIRSLDTIADIDFTDKEAAAIEGRARVLARQKLQSILEPFVDYQDQADTDAGVRAKAEDAGL